MLSCIVCRSERAERFCHVADRDRPAKSWEIRWCRECGYGWTWPRISPTEIDRYYPPTYLGDTKRTLSQFLAGVLQKSRSWRHETEKVTLVERFSKPGPILDVGCSNGKFLLALDRRVWQPVGVEYIEQVVATVRRYLPDLSIFHGDIYSPELKAGFFQALTLWHVLEHLFEPERVLRRARQLLRPGGWLFISSPNFDSLQVRLFRHHWYAFDAPRHRHHFSPRSLRRLLHSSSFEIRQEVFFSRLNNRHQLKHSLIHWSEEHFSSRVPYYFLKPLLSAFSPLEILCNKYGILTTVAQAV